MVTVQPRYKYECDLESELDLNWGEGAIVFCKQNGGKRWSIQGGVWIEKSFENQPPTVPFTEDSTHRFATDAEKTTWNGKQDTLGFTPVPSTRTVNGQALSSNISLGKPDVGLGNADNTSDANKPISTATQTALTGKEAANANIQAHIASAHAPSNAQKNSDILKSEVETVLTGKITTHTHGLNNFSVTDQTINAGTSALLTGSLLSVPVGKLQIGTILKFRLTLSKTAAGTAANTFFLRIGTNGTVADSAILTFTLPVGTAAVDVGQIDITITIRGPLSGSCIAQGVLALVHNLSATGLATIPCVVLNVTSSGFDATVANLKVSLSCTTAALTVLTFQQVISEVINL